MEDDRRYRQRGYQDRPGEPRERADRARPSQPQPARMLGSRSVSRCAECGTLVPPGTDVSGRCPKCEAELHACKQCANFDPGRPNECTEPIPERIPSKVARNDCALFALRVVVERDTSATPGGGPAPPPPMRPDDARRAFDSLFKKPQ